MFVQRNAQGEIAEASKNSHAECSEKIADDHPDIVAFNTAMELQMNPPETYRDKRKNDPDMPELGDVIDALCKGQETGDWTEFNSVQAVRNAVIIALLLVAWADPRRWMAYSRDKNWYTRAKRSVGRLGSYAQKVAERNLFCFAAANSAKHGHWVVPWLSFSRP